MLHPAESIVAAALPFAHAGNLPIKVRLKLLWEVAWQVEEVLLAAVPLVFDDHADVILKLKRFGNQLVLFGIVGIHRWRGVIISGILVRHVFQL